MVPCVRVYLASSPEFSGTLLSYSPHVCRDCDKLKAIVRPSQRPLKVDAHDFAALLPVSHLAGTSRTYNDFWIQSESRLTFGANFLGIAAV